MRRLCLVVGIIGSIMSLSFAADGETPTELLAMARVAAGKGENDKALPLLNQVIAKDAKVAEAYDLRGSVHFKLGKFKESLADFDKYLEMKPQDGPGHWRRGITCYYAGAFDEGRKQ